MRAVLDLAEDYERLGRAAAVTVTGGFPYADVTRAGLAVTVTTNADPGSATEIAGELANRVWAWRDRFQVDDIAPVDAVARARRAVNSPGQSGPVVIADTADNPGAGAPGNATLLLRELIDQGVERAAVATIADPAAVRAVDRSPVGTERTVRLGDGASLGSGEPIERTWTIRWSGDGVFVNSGPIGTGGVTRLGRTAVLRSGGVDVIVCERRVQVLDPAIFPSVGIDPRAASVLAIKSSVHYRAGFANLASAMIEAGGSGVSCGDLRRLPYAAIRRPIMPLDPDAVFDA
jgi:microcystin degradation protein MlrC